VGHAPMRLLEPGRMVADEGLPRALLIAFRVLTNPAARKRVLAMRKVFRAHADALTGVALVARKKAA
ncbi:MAG: class I SAM-dependent methyltransferase, partial [Propionibacteriaceae bacterium]|nr:class I SAM-dependent methyltransferase [Propionibacteriaceae bacterium]